MLLTEVFKGGWQIAGLLAKSSMTPEQLAELLKAFHQHDWFLVVCGVVWLLGAVLQFLIVKRIESAIANKQHFTRARYDREIEIYQKVWPKLMNFYEVMVLGSNADPNSGLAYHKARNEVIDAVRENRPFFPKEIRQEVLAFQGLCENQKFSEFVIRVRELSSDEKKTFFESQEKMKAQLDKVEEAIRNRLIKFD